MNQKNTGRLSFFLHSVKNVYSIFFSMGRRAKKTKMFFLFSFLPVVIAFIIKFNQIFSGRSNVRGIYIFSNLIIVFYLQFLILILALFFGTSVGSEEIEGQTLTYLTTRPVSKSAIVLGKYSAYTTLVIIMMAVGVLLSFLILMSTGLYWCIFYPF